MSNINIQKRISTLINQLTSGIQERDQIMAISLLAVISGQNTFLYGPPGTAKSLISRRLASAFEQANYFEYLMNRFTTPEDVFGPVSIKELKEDRYIRKTEGYLPEADFAFLDEIWKSSPAILNNLLTIINEHIFKNGNEKISVPLKSLIAASNEIPPENQGLEALYDRFIVRLLVPPIQDENNFNHLINSKPSSDTSKIENQLRLKYDEIKKWRDDIYDVQLSSDTILIIKAIRHELSKQDKKLNVYVSDRRWQRAAILLKASAFLNGRKETNHSDIVLLKYCLWTTPENREKIEKIVMNAIQTCGFSADVDIPSLDKQKSQLDKEINKELYIQKDVYETIKLDDGNLYFEVKGSFRDRYNRSRNSFEGYIPFTKFRTQDTFQLIDKNGNNHSYIQCNFDNQGSCHIKNTYYDYEEFIFTPKILYRKGDKKTGVNERLINSLAGSVKDIRTDLSTALENVKNKFTEYKQELSSPFITEQETDSVLQGILKQIDDLELRIADCKRLEALCH